jgi:hypothetical protein
LVNLNTVKPDESTRTLPRLVWRSWTFATRLALARGTPTCALATAAALAALARTPAKRMYVRFKEVFLPDLGSRQSRRSLSITKDAGSSGILPVAPPIGRRGS